MQKTPIYPTRRPIITLMTMTIALPALSFVTHAQDADGLPVAPAEVAGDISSLAKREMLRRKNAVYEADQLLLAGREAYAADDFQKAVDKYSQALQMVPDAPLFAKRRQSLTAHLTDANVALAMKHRELGKKEEARALLENVRELDPYNYLAERELEALDDPLRTNPALDEDHVKNVQEVKKALVLAQGQYDLGKYDDAKSAYNNVLRIDPFNKAARRGLERIAAIKTDYYRAAYDHTRAELLMQVDRAWELTVPSNEPQVAYKPNRGNNENVGVAYITEKLRRTIIPEINFDNTPVEEAIAYLRQRSIELDPVEMDPERKGVNFVIRRPQSSGGGDEGGLGLGDPVTGGGDPSSLIIDSLSVRGVPLQEALKMICEQVKLRYKVGEYAVTLVPQTETGEDIFTRNFNVPPDFKTSIHGGGDGGGAADADPFADPGAGGGTDISPLPPIKELLEQSGISFAAEGTSATLSGTVLLVSNTPTELDKIEQLVDAMANKQPKQVKITTKFVEITQENGEELGFDWVVGPFFSGDGNMAGSGGTIGSGGTRTGLDFSGPLIPGVTGSDVNVNNIVTAGNRSGDLANARNSIDAILNNTSRATQAPRVAPGILSFTGLFSDGQLKVIMRGLSQKKGTDLMTAPSVTAKPGDKATIEIIREFIYPTEYDPPELQQGGGNNNNGGGNQDDGNQAAVQAFPVVPANPTAFETRNTGVTLEIEPNFGDDDFMIDLRFIPEIVEFEGFINYGSPIQTAGTDGDGNPVQVVITENRIEMPIFSTRRVTTGLTIYDGYTVAIGGLMREDVQNVQDQVPILGDLPLIGRLFQTKAENRIKSNLIIFVTAQIIDPTGRPLRGADAAPSGVMAE